MTRAAAFTLLTTLVALSQVMSGFADDAALNVASANPPLATPAPYDNGEMPDAAPLSLLIENHGRLDDRLLGGSAPAADRVEIHTSRLDNGARQMLPTQAIIIPADGTLLLEPAGAHLMLVGLRENLVQGQSLPLTLHFARAGEITVTVRVRRKVDAAGLTPIPPLTVGDLTVSLASAPPASRDFEESRSRVESRSATTPGG